MNRRRGQVTTDVDKTRQCKLAHVVVCSNQSLTTACCVTDNTSNINYCSPTQHSQQTLVINTDFTHSIHCSCYILHLFINLYLLFIQPHTCTLHTDQKLYSTFNLSTDFSNVFLEWLCLTFKYCNRNQTKDEFLTEIN